MEDLSNYRKSYDKTELLENSIPEDPINLFNRWFHEVEDFGGVDEVNAMTVSTLGLDGFPKARVVLLKKYTFEGFIFYTNYNSEKGKAISNNPNICLSFFWHSLYRSGFHLKYGLEYWSTIPLSKCNTLHNCDPSGLTFAIDGRILTPTTRTF